MMRWGIRGGPAMAFVPVVGSGDFSPPLPPTLDFILGQNRLDIFGKRGQDNPWRCRMAARRQGYKPKPRILL